MSTWQLDPAALGAFVVQPPQCHRGIRLVPLCAPRPEEDLRATHYTTGQDLSLVQLDTGTYVSRIPYGVVLSWTNDGSPVVPGAVGPGPSATPNPAKASPARRRRRARAERGPPKGEGPTWQSWLGTLGLLRGMERRLRPSERRPGEPHALRILPLHLEMSAFLETFFRGPTVQWPEYDWRAVRFGLLIRHERSLGGRGIPGLEDALRFFEVLENQVGMLIFIGDTFASAFVAPHPDDYRPLHERLIEDFYQQHLYWLAQVPGGAAPWNLTMEGEIRSFADLRTSLDAMRAAWGQAALEATGGLRAPWTMEERYEAGPFRLHRFHTGYRPGEDNHVGECVLRPDGRIGWLKTFLLSRDQTDRARFLHHLSRHDWHLDRSAEGLGMDRGELVRALHRVGLSRIIRRDVLDRALAG